MSKLSSGAGAFDFHHTPVSASINRSTGPVDTSTLSTCLANDTAIKDLSVPFSKRMKTFDALSPSSDSEFFLQSRVTTPTAAIVLPIAPPANTTAKTTSTSCSLLQGTCVADDSNSTPRSPTMNELMAMVQELCESH
jgi:hypothetical protein